MQSNSASLKKNNSIQMHGEQYEGSPYAIRDLQKTIDPRNFLDRANRCQCDLCVKEKPNQLFFQDYNLFATKSISSTRWLKTLLDNLCLTGTKSLKINLPDLLFVVGQSFQTFQTNRINGRLVKLSGTNPLKSLYPTMLRYLKQYKYMLQLNFNQKMFESIDPDFMHLSYFDKFVPSYFHEGMSNIDSLQKNRSQFKRYVLHTNQKYQIQQIEEHKINNKEAFCIVKYTDGNCQLFTQIQFEHFMLGTPNKIQQSVVFVQSYIKYKLEARAIYYSEYTLTPHTPFTDLDKRAQLQVMILLGAVNKLQKSYTDPATLDDISHQMMLQTPQAFVDLLTSKIVHYLNMTARIYIEHLKIKWIMNDLGNIYLQQIMQFDMTEVPRRMIKYRLPPKEEALDIVTNTNNFGQIYLELKKRKNINTRRIRQMVTDKKVGQIQEMMEIDFQDEVTEEKDQISLYFKNKMKQQKRESASTQFRTIETSHTQRLHRAKLINNQTQKQHHTARVTARSLHRGRSITVEQGGDLFQKQPKQRLRQSFNRYFTINRTLQSKKGRKLTLAPQTSKSSAKRSNSPMHNYTGRYGPSPQIATNPSHKNPMILLD